MKNNKLTIFIIAIALAIIISGCTNYQPTFTPPTGNETASQTPGDDISKYFINAYLSSDCAPSADHHEPIPATVFKQSDQFCLVTKQAKMSFTMSIKTFQNGTIVGNIASMNIQKDYSSTSGGANPYSPGSYQMELYANNNDKPFAILPFEVR